MIPISVIIITKNEGHIIDKTLRSIRDLTDDIVIVDSGSTDRTLSIAEQYNCRVLQTTWDGYGENKNKGIALAKYNWIMSIDADEILSEELYLSLSAKTFFNENIVYRLKFQIYVGNVLLKYGQPGRVRKARIFNKKRIHWNSALVHERLILPKGIICEDLPGNILHYSYRDIDHCIEKTNLYTTLVAQQLFFSEKKFSFLKLYVNPLFTFTRNYIFKLGFLDGFWGYTYASMNSYYCYLKYAKLKELQKKRSIELPVAKKYSQVK